MAAFAERTKRSLKSILHRYMENYRYKYIHNLSQFVTTLTARKNCSIILIPKMSRILTFCPFCTEIYKENIKNLSLVLEAEFLSPSMSYLSGRFISHSLHGKFFELLERLSEILQHTQ